ncbi:MAG TPA: hypothetical protein PLN21_08975 [Gemmatales bacterium]|nr:hypothetical protein [Gemmatales bacterium]
MSLEQPEIPALPVSSAPVLEEVTAKKEPACSNLSHVYIYFIHGLDPCDYANLRGVEQICHDLGYANTVYVTMTQSDEVISHVECTKARDPQARIVIYGYSAGADIARRVTNKLHDRDGIDVDLLFYVSGIILIDTKSARPEYVGKIVHILDGGKIIPGMKLSGADNYRFSDVWHFGTPMHPRTLAILEEELKQQALLVGNGK